MCEHPAERKKKAAASGDEADDAGADAAPDDAVAGKKRAKKAPKDPKLYMPKYRSGGYVRKLAAVMPAHACV